MSGSAEQNKQLYQRECTIPEYVLQQSTLLCRLTRHEESF